MAKDLQVTFHGGHFVSLPRRRLLLVAAIAGAGVRFAAIRISNLQERPAMVDAGVPAAMIKTAPQYPGSSGPLVAFLAF